MGFLSQNAPPFEFYFYNIEKFKMHSWPNRLNFLLTLNKPVYLYIGEQQNSLCPNEVFLVGRQTHFHIDADQFDSILCFELDLTFFDSYYTNFSKLNFQLTDNKREIYEIIVSLYVESMNTSKNHYLKMNLILLQLGLLLLNKCVLSDSKEQNSTFNERINQIADYIREHFREKITLTDLSSFVHLNPQYLSRFFSKYTNVPLEDFIAQIRLQESLKDLCYSNKSLVEVALQSGFANQKAYGSACKKYLGFSPQTYRKAFKVSETKKYEPTTLEQFALTYFTKLLNQKNQGEIFNFKKDKINIDCSKVKGKLSHSWRKALGFMRASDALRAPLRDQLHLIQQDMPFEYARFHGIFSDDMMVYNEDSSGQPIFNFNLVDEVLDFLEEIKLKPWIELGYMPEKLASEDRHLYKWNANISGPKDMEKWTLLIRTFIKHIIERYGKKQIDTWLFEIWDDPDYGNRYFPKLQNYNFLFFKNTLKALKKVDNNLKVGGVNLIASAILETNILSKLYQSIEHFPWKLDFCTFYVYSYQYQDEIQKALAKEVTNTSFQPQDSLTYTTYAEEQFLTKSIDKVLSLLYQYPIAPQIYINEWNLNPDPHDIFHDTCFKAPFIIKNVLNNCAKVDVMGYWAFSDIFDEVIYSDNITFHGGLGILTDNGLKKPSYFAFWFLSKLGHSIVFQNDYSIITKDLKGSFQILIFNYCHFANSQLSHCDSSIQLKNRYGVFTDHFLEVEFSLSAIQGEYRKRVYRVNRENGSVYDDWVKIGAQIKISNEEIQYLSKKAIYNYSSENIFVYDEYILHERLKPHEILLIILEPKTSD
jgi:xylan 1,4-beta-xylosidase